VANTTKAKESRGDFLWCCDVMASQMNWKCAHHAEASDCPAALIGRFGNRSYGLLMHDGGTSFIGMNFCPWCGKALSLAPRASAET
jgi:ssDNA-binding Zn-finger/Zn-ribbon topoisomerase 1